LVASSHHFLQADWRDKFMSDELVNPDATRVDEGSSPCPVCGAGPEQSADPASMWRSVCYCGHPRYYDYKVRKTSRGRAKDQSPQLPVIGGGCDA